MSFLNDDEETVLARLEATGWERFEGEPDPGFEAMVSPSGVQLQRPSLDGPEGARFVAILAGHATAFEVVQAEAARAEAEGRVSNVVSFPPRVLGRLSTGAPAERPRLIAGRDLTEAQRRTCLAQYVDRYTGDHTPAWAAKVYRDGRSCPIHFESDAEWLENSRFAVSAAGELILSEPCHSMPTWPNNPELRSGAEVS